MAKKKDNKPKKGVFKRDKERTQRILQNICAQEQTKTYEKDRFDGKDKKPAYETHKKVDVVTGDTYTHVDDIETLATLIAREEAQAKVEKLRAETQIGTVETVKIDIPDKKASTAKYGSTYYQHDATQKKGGFPITHRVVTPTKVVQPKSGSIYMIGIEITGSVDSVIKQIERSVEFYIADFYQFVFFSNNIHKSFILKRGTFKPEKLRELVETAKEQEKLLPKENVLLYDAIDEALYLQKEKNALSASRVQSYGVSKYSLDNIKYLFLISGEELGSQISKDELQLLIKEARLASDEFEVALRKSTNLSNIASLGFRNIKAYG